MRQSFHLIVVILSVLFVSFSGAVHAAEKPVFIGGVWYNQQRDGSLTVCQECNAGRPPATAQAVQRCVDCDCPTSYPCQMMRPQFVTVQSVETVGTVESVGLFRACSSGSCGASAAQGLFTRRPIRSFFSRLFGGGCGG